MDDHHQTAATFPVNQKGMQETASAVDKKKG
jgi:hypothetical protein